MILYINCRAAKFCQMMTIRYSLFIGRGGGDALYIDCMAAPWCQVMTRRFIIDRGVRVMLFILIAWLLRGVR